MVDKIIQAGRDNWALLLLITALTGGTTTLTGMIPDTSTIYLEQRVTTNERAIKIQAESTTCMSAKLDKILNNQAVVALETKYRDRDRWTATMQKDFQAEWVEIVRGLHPEFSGTVAPSITEIQHRYPEGREGM